MEESLTREISKAKRSGATIGIIMIDIDHFKVFNDNFGHAAGDAMLRALSIFLKASVRSCDIACRYGGEEFILILPDANTADTAVRAGVIREKVKNLKIPYEDQVFHITLSLGVAAYPEHGNNLDAVLRCADNALYKAKELGRDRVEVFPPDRH